MALSGTFTPQGFNETFVMEAGGNLYYSSHDVHTYTGTFTGTDVFEGTIVIYKDGRIRWQGKSTFAGTVAGCGTGTVVMEAVGGADSLTGPAHCHQETIGGTLPLHAAFDLVGTTASFTYSGSYSC